MTLLKGSNNPRMTWHGGWRLVTGLLPQIPDTRQKGGRTHGLQVPNRRAHAALSGPMQSAGWSDRNRFRQHPGNPLLGSWLLLFGCTCWGPASRRSWRQKISQHGSKQTIIWKFYVFTANSQIRSKVPHLSFTAGWCEVSEFTPGQHII